MENDRVNLARSFIKAILKAKKMLQIYPSNNVIYLTAMAEAYAVAKECLDLHGDLTCRIKPTEMLVDSDQIYQSPGKTENVALFFFKEGIREIVFKEGLPKAELEEFLRLMGIDYDRDDSASDFLSEAWERGFEHIKFTIDELIFSEGDGNGDDPQGQGTSQQEKSSLEGMAGGAGTLFLSEVRAQGDISDEGGIAGEGTAAGIREDDEILSAYKDALARDEVVLPSFSELTTEERGLMMDEMNRDPSEKSDKLAQILVIMLKEARGTVEAGKIARSLENVILYSLRRNDLVPPLITFREIRRLPSGTQEAAEIKEQAEHILDYCRSPEVMEILGRMLDTSKEFNEDALHEYASHLGKESVDSFVTLLEHLESIHARRMVNNILIRLGREDADALRSRLKDPTWYVVRNMVYILRNIGNNAVLEDILTVARHEHPRVRLEVVKALNDFKSVRALQALKEYFDDPDSTVRLTAIAVIGAMVKDNSGARQFARDAVIAKIMGKGFEERDFREKKSFYETLAMFGDSEADEYMIRALTKKSIFGGRKNVEARSCAAYYLGLTGNREAIPLLDKLSKSSEPLLREHAVAALQRLRNE